jgi:N-acetylmuramate 1-kinase
VEEKDTKLIVELIEEVSNRPGSEVRVTPMVGDASTRRYYRVAVVDAGGQRSFVAMILPDDPHVSDEISAGRPPAELPFVNLARHLSRVGLRVPRIELEAVARGALILEDLGETLLIHRVGEASRARRLEWYRAAVDLLVRMHERMWPAPPGCVAGERRFDYELLRWELDHYREWGAEALRGEALPASVRAQLDAAFDELARELARLPIGFVHRDYQSRNLMVVADSPSPESLAIIDFQDAFAGPRIYDLVALLNDSYVDLDEEFKREMIGRYAAARGLDSNELYREFVLTSLQRKLKDGGRFVFIDRVRGNPKFLPFIDASFSRVREYLGQLNGHAALKDALAGADPTRFG